MLFPMYALKVTNTGDQQLKKELLNDLLFLEADELIPNHESHLDSVYDYFIWILKVSKY